MTPPHSVVDARKYNDTAELSFVSYMLHDTHQRVGTYDDNVPVERFRSQLVRRLREEVHDEA